MSPDREKPGDNGHTIGRDQHLGYILAMTYSPDGRRLYYAAAGEGVVYVRDTASGARRARWPCHDGPVMELRCPGAGRELFTASLDGTVGVWRSADGASIRRLGGFRQGVHSLDVSDQHVAAGGFDGLVQIWGRGSDTTPARLEAHQDTVTAVALISSSRLITASRDRTLRVWDLDRQRALRTLTGHRSWVTRLAALPDGRRVISAGEDGMCVLWDCATGERLWHGETDSPVWALAVAPNGEFAATGSRVTRWDVATGAGHALPGARATRAIAISPDSAIAACGCDHGNVTLYDLSRGQVAGNLASAADASAALAAAVDAEARYVAVGRRDGAIRLLHSASGGERTLAPDHGAMAYTLCRIDHDRFASGGFDGIVRVWDFEHGKLLCQLDHGGQHVFSVAASADARRLLSGGSDRWCLWDVDTGQAVSRQTRAGAGVHCVAGFTAEGWIMSAGESDEIRLWRPDGTLEGSVTHGAGFISALCWCRGRGPVLADARGRLSLLDLDTGSCQRLHEDHEDWIRAVHASPDGRYVASVSQNFICRLYDLEQRRLVNSAALRSPIPAADFAANGDLIALSASGDVLSVPAVSR